MRRAALVLGGLAALVMIGSCNTYKYFEMHVTFDPATLDSSQTGYISSCIVTVSGADSTSFRISDAVCPPRPGSVAPLDVGTFEFSTFADSGSLTFTLDAYTGIGQMANCKLGQGKTTVNVTGETTISGMILVSKVGEACHDGVTNPKVDGGP